MEAVYIEGVLRRRSIQDLIGASLVPDAQCLVTTRLDSDDALASHFVKETQKNLTHFDLPYVINFSSGLVKYRNNLYEVEERSSSFLSLCEAPSKKVLTVFAKNHNKWGPEYKVLQVKSMHSWLRCIHSKNLHNTKQGTKISQSIRIHSFTFGIRNIELIDSKSGRFSMALKLNYRVLRNHIQRYAKILRV